MDVIWGNAGHSMFDFYSLHHIVWFIAITTMLTAIFRERAWLAVIAVAIMWEIFEKWVADNVPGFPFAGKEEILNKFVGDSISDLIGFLIAQLSIGSLKKWWKNG
jgi:hypothetical protein